MKKLNYKNVLNHKSWTKNKGITLIALIVTIITVLILTSVSIAVLSNSVIIKKSKFAGETYQNKINEEEKAIQNYASTMNEYTIADTGRDEKLQSTKKFTKLFDGISSPGTYSLNDSIENYTYIIFYIGNLTDNKYLQEVQFHVEFIKQHYGNTSNAFGLYSYGTYEILLHFINKSTIAIDNFNYNDKNHHIYAIYAD